MRRSTILFSCARFMMLSLCGARQISGNKVRMSIFNGQENIELLTWNVQLPMLYRRSMTAETKEAALTRLRGASAWQAARHHRKLFYNFEHGALAMARRGTGK